MKHIKTLKGLLLSLLLICTSTVSAYDFEVNGIYYKIRTGTEVYVTAKNTNSSFNEYGGHINIPETVEYSGITFDVVGIGSYAFRYSSIESITIPPTITFTGYEAFKYCHVKDVYISDLYAWCNIYFDINGGVMDGANLYLNNQLVTELSIPNGITKINNYAFGGCKSIKSVIIPNSVVQIGNWAFGSCENLANVEIPNSVTRIGSYAFCSCAKLEELDLPQSLTYIGSGAFENCSGLKNMIIPTGVSVIYDETFRNCTNLATISAHNTITKIGEQAFYGCSELKNFTIPSGIIEIYEGTFAYSGLNNITINNGVKYIDDDAFAHTPLVSISIPQSTISIGEGVFTGCNKVETILIDKNNTVYDSRDNCNAIIETATNKLIFGCKSTIIPNSVSSIGEEAFEGCWELKNIIIPNSVIDIGYDAFRDCKGLIDICIPNSVTTIRGNAFDSCENLESVFIGANVTNIGSDAFINCLNLAKIEVDKGNVIYDSRDNCNAIIKTATNTLIQGCENTIIPSSVTSIGESAFYNCLGITYIVIPYNVASVKWRAFSGCSNLKDIEFNSNPLIDTNAIPSTAKCHLMLNDNNVADFNTANTNTFADVSYTRTISEGKYGTIILPFAPDAASVENYAFYELVESGEGYMKFDEVAQPIANTPYIYTLREGKENVAITGGETTISSNIETPVVSEWETIGSFSKQTIDTSNGNYYAFSPSKNEINKITKNLTVLPYRAYFKSDNASKSAFSVYISGTTGVKEVLSSEIDGFETEVIYDLSGRKILDPVKGGIYIINGKKVKF